MLDLQVRPRFPNWFYLVVLATFLHNVELQSTQCPQGQTCIACGAGWYFNTTTALCEQCQVNTYNPLPDAVECLPCASGLVSLGTAKACALQADIDCVSPQWTGFLACFFNYIDSSIADDLPHDELKCMSYYMLDDCSYLKSACGVNTADVLNNVYRPYLISRECPNLRNRTDLRRCLDGRHTNGFQPQLSACSSNEDFYDLLETRSDEKKLVCPYVNATFECLKSTILKYCTTEAHDDIAGFLSPNKPDICASYETGCGTGWYLNSPGSCVACPSNTYQPYPHEIAQTDNNQCLKCTTDFVSSAGAATCTDCKQHYYLTGTNCTQCPSGKELTVQAGALSINQCYNVNDIKCVKDAYTKCGQDDYITKIAEQYTHSRELFCLRIIGLDGCSIANCRVDAAKILYDYQHAMFNKDCGDYKELSSCMALRASNGLDDALHNCTTTCFHQYRTLLENSADPDLICSYVNDAFSCYELAVKKHCQATGAFVDIQKMASANPCIGFPSCGQGYYYNKTPTTTSTSATTPTPKLTPSPGSCVACTANTSNSFPHTVSCLPCASGFVSSENAAVCENATLVCVRTAYQDCLNQDVFYLLADYAGLMNLTCIIYYTVDGCSAVDVCGPGASAMLNDVYRPSLISAQCNPTNRPELTSCLDARHTTGLQDQITNCSRATLADAPTLYTANAYMYEQLFCPYVNIFVDCLNKTIQDSCSTKASNEFQQMSNSDYCVKYQSCGRGRYLGRYCIACPFNTYQPYPHAFSDPLDELFPRLDGVCSPCKTGFESGEGSPTCTVCKVGYYVDGTNCTQCPNNKTTMFSDTPSINECYNAADVSCINTIYGNCVQADYILHMAAYINYRELFCLRITRLDDCSVSSCGADATKMLQEFKQAMFIGICGDYTDLASCVALSTANVFNNGALLNCTTTHFQQYKTLLKGSTDVDLICPYVNDAFKCYEGAVNKHCQTTGAFVDIGTMGSASPCAGFTHCGPGGYYYRTSPSATTSASVTSPTFSTTTITSSTFTYASTSSWQIYQTVTPISPGAGHCASCPTNTYSSVPHTVDKCLQCESGFVSLSGSKTCTDDDECAVKITNNCSGNAKCLNTPGSYNCSCNEGYTGNGTHCDDINECDKQTDNCSDYATCVNAQGGFNCYCLKGFTGNGTDCDDDNECKDKTHDCSGNARCANTQGSFICSCNGGYTGNGTSCYDINECKEGNNNCTTNAKCLNTQGGFNCQCEEGYTGNGIFCQDIKECAQNSHNCDQNADCVEIEGSFNCICISGFTGNGTDCFDIYECDINTDNCSENAKCINTHGGFSCSCHKGFSGNGTVCADDDECTLKSDNCGGSATCVNTPGGFNCFCKNGFTGDGIVCTDDDECKLKTDNCTGNATCFNTLGAFICSCKDGYTGNDIFCYDLNECDRKTDNCTENAFCINTQGGFNCSCSKGFTDNGTVCADVNECDHGSHNCSGNAKCVNTQGGYNCSCRKGFAGNGTVCEDVNECTDQTATCSNDAGCDNTHGGFTCLCNNGYTGDGKYCQDINECDLKTDNCNGNAECLNTPGGFNCSCHKGFTGNGTDCADDDECQLSTDNCNVNARCVNTEGGFNCYCHKGFTRNGTYCNDDNECTLNTHNCSSNAECLNTQGGFNCTCYVGFTGDGMICEDVNECTNQTANCSSDARCDNTKGSFTCVCNDGYTGDGTFCQDVNECDLKTDNCSGNATCLNIPGQFNCSCYNGFIGDGMLCEDIHECQDHTDNCSSNATCINIPGGFNCSCYKGFTGDGMFCEDVNECQIKTANCSGNATCHNTHGSFNCVCNDGYTGDGTSCQDVNECDLKTDNCSGNATCLNMPGRFNCSCYNGFIGDGVICEDVDECHISTDNCSMNATCHNTPGGFKCSCYKGFTGDGMYCEEVNECQIKTANCSGNATCHNTEGSFNCVCNDGYTGDGTSCQDVNECDLKTDNCSGNAECLNTPGRFNCSCYDGFIGDGMICDDVHECHIGIANCSSNAICLNTQGGFNCSCNDGFIGNGMLCDDTDECDLGTNNCSGNATCVNTQGGFNCSCYEGFTGDGRVCEDIDECKGMKHNCNNNATCFNIQGGFNCLCNEGYTGNGIFCQAIIYCAENSHNCDMNAVCLELETSFSCVCMGGFTGNGTYCIDIDECKGVKHICANNAKCSNKQGGFDCLCNDGFTGNGTFCQDIEECASNSHNCDQNAICMEIDGSFNCICRSGFKGNGTYCIDVNECDLKTSNCSPNATCHNTEGGFNCSCYNGFTGNGTYCTDDDECHLVSHNCNSDARCLNTQGGFNCFCNDGYTGNGTICYDINECGLQTDTCSSNAACINTVGRFNCSCHKGFTGDGIFCKDDNECDQGTDNCSSNAECVNTDGGFNCSCKQSYTGNGTHCEDVDECDLKLDNCHSNATCRNTPGGFKCSCLNGFTGDGVVLCSDDDECAMGTHNCSRNAKCLNTPGGLKCFCHNGFSGNGTVCEDVDECKLKRDNCSSNATCQNTQGGFNCTCNGGYIGNGVLCEDKPECSDGSHNCDSDARCIETIGSFYCVCKRGFTGNGTVCIDDDECDLKTHNCNKNAICDNIPGSFTCVCHEGFSGNGVFCEDISCPALPILPHAHISTRDTSGILVWGKIVTYTCNTGFQIIRKVYNRHVICVVRNNVTSWDIGALNNCTDADECKWKNNCTGKNNQTCQNEIGTYKCNCLNGLYMDQRQECSTPIRTVIMFKILKTFVASKDQGVKDDLRNVITKLFDSKGITFTNLTIRTKNGSINVTVQVDLAETDVGEVNTVLEDSMKEGKFGNYPVDPMTRTMAALNNYTCLPGQEPTRGPNADVHVCMACAKGSFKTSSKRERCTECSGTDTTSNIGALFKEQCFARCGPGAYLENKTSTGRCFDCAKDTYNTVDGRIADQPVLQCTPCDKHYFTKGQKSKSVDNCKDLCAAELEFPERFGGSKYCKNSGDCEFNRTAKQPTCNCKRGFKGTTCTVKVTLVDNAFPMFGPKAGGTLIELKGIHLNHTDGPVVYLGNKTCTLLNSSDTVIFCRTKRSDDEGDFTLTIRWTKTGTSLIYSKRKFTYWPDPVIERVYPKKGIIKGGTTVTVEGSNLQGIGRPSLQITIIVKNSTTTSTYVFSAPCKRAVVGRNNLKCQTPDIDGLPEAVIDKLVAEAVALQVEEETRKRRRRRQAGADGNNTLTVYVGVDIKLDDANKNSTITDFTFSKPDVYRFLDDYEVFRPFWPFGQTEIYIWGRHLSPELESEVVVHIGGGVCPEMDLSSTNLIICRPSSTRPPEGDYDKPGNRMHVQVDMGSTLNFSIGYLEFQENIMDYAPGRIGIIAGSVAFVVVVATIVLLVRCSYRYRGDPGLHIPRGIESPPSFRSYSVYSSEPHSSLFRDSKIRGKAYNDTILNGRRRGPIGNPWR